MKGRGIYHLILATALAILAGCGGGGGGTTQTPPTTFTKAIVKVRTSGSLQAGTTITAIDATVTYPTSLSITESGVAPSGVGTGSFIAANVIATPGQARLALLNVSGIQTGEFATLTFSIPSGSSPVTSDFAIAANASILDNSNPPATPTGITVGVQSVEFQ